MVNIKCGSTRLVFLVGTNAIKIGRFRPIRFLLRIPLILFSEKRKQHFFRKYGDSLLKAVVGDLCAGLYANRNEYQYWTESKDCRVMPVVRSLLFGWVIIQLRGKPISSNDLSGISYITRTLGFENCEMGEPSQFCRHPNGSICLVDYGRRVTCEALKLS